MEEHVESIKSLLTSIVSRDERSEAKKNRTSKSTPHTFKTHNKNRVENDGLQKELFDNDLSCLDNLSNNDKNTTKSALKSGDLLLGRRGSIKRRRRVSKITLTA